MEHTETLVQLLARITAEAMTREEAIEAITSRFCITRFGAEDLLDNGIKEEGWWPCESRTS